MNLYNILLMLCMIKDDFVNDYSNYIKSIKEKIRTLVSSLYCIVERRDALMKKKLLILTWENMIC
jgi:hypothetical protein